jgi:hypothetical protein
VLHSNACIHFIQKLFESWTLRVDQEEEEIDSLRAMGMRTRRKACTLPQLEVNVVSCFPNASHSYRS